MIPLLSQRSLLCLLCLLGSTATAAPPPWNPAAAISDPGWRWSGPQALDLPGVQLQFQHFQTSAAPVQAAQRMVQAAAPRQLQLQFQGRVLQLTAWHGDRHWLVQLQPQAQGTRGVVSSLAVQRPTLAFDPAAYVPRQARRVLHVSTRMPQSAGLLASYDSPGAADQVADSVHRALRAARWEPTEPPVSGAGSSTWRRHGAGHLNVRLYARDRSVGITFWHRPEGTQ